MQECPNCGSAMRLCRIDRQNIESRPIVLRWLICEQCKHVLLGQWEWERLVIEELPAPEEHERVVHRPHPGHNGRNGKSR